jgi:hypothetical protein
MSNSKQTRTVGSRKRRRNKSLDRSIENSNKKSKQISNEIILSNLTQTNSMILAASGLNNQQMVCFSFVYLFINIFFLETNKKICFTF